MRTLYSLIESHETFYFSGFWGGEKCQRQNSWFYKDLSLPLISKTCFRERKTYTRINALSWKGDVPVKWKLSPEGLCFDAIFIGAVAKDFPHLLFVRKGSRNSSMLSLVLHNCSSGLELLLGFKQVSLGHVAVLEWFLLLLLCWVFFFSLN